MANTLCLSGQDFAKLATVEANQNPSEMQVLLESLNLITGISSNLQLL
jgi:hypothetical protein